MRHTPLINYALYQIGWFVCVLGGASHRPWTGFLIAVLLIGVHLTLSLERSLELRLVVLATAVGAVVEMVQIACDPREVAGHRGHLPPGPASG